MQQLTKALLDKKGSFISKILFIGYSIFLFIVTLMPTAMFKSEGGSWLSKINFENGDKVVHAILFFIFSLLLYFSGYIEKKFRLVLVPVLVGIGIEILQLVTAWGRTFDVYDIFANALGTLLAYFITQKLIASNSFN